MLADNFLAYLLRNGVKLTDFRAIRRAYRVRKALKIHKKAFPYCAWCGATKGTLAVHHHRPISKFPELAAQPDNLITLCHNKKRKCHFVVGHFNNWKNWNPELLGVKLTNSITRAK